MADSPILDYYRATDLGCTLQRIGEIFVEDTYAIGMVKGFPLKESISALIAKYSSNGYLDILTEKWYGGLPCFKYESEIVTPRPLGRIRMHTFNRNYNSTRICRSMLIFCVFISAIEADGRLGRSGDK